ncbi:MAG: methyl-accepting chemotaxis protein [Tumebacillaceae bacterium]
MGKLFRVKIKTRLYVSFLFILLIPSLVIGAISYETAKTKVGDSMTQTATQNMKLLDDAMNKWIEPEIKNVQYLSHLVTASSFDGHDNLALRKQLMYYQELHPELVSTYVGTQSGLMVQEPMLKLPDGYDPRKAEWYQQAMAQKSGYIITAPYQATGNGQWVITLARVTEDASGVIAFDLNLNELSKIAKQVQIGQAGYVVMIDQNNKVLFYPTLKTGAAATDLPVDTLKKSQEGLFDYSYQGQAKHMAFVTNRYTTWKIAGTWDVNEVTQAASSIFNTTALVLAIALVLGGAIVYLIVISITRPLRSLLVATERINEGDLTDRITVRSGDELGELSTHFNTMVDSLRGVLLGVGESASQLAASSEELTASAGQTSRATEHIAHTIEAMAVGSERQVRSVEDTDRTITDMSAGVQQIATNAQHVSATAMHASQVAVDGSLAVHKATEQMSSISATVNSLADSIRGLGDKTQHIGKIVEAITSIADQTSLLALNAAIEAARAGEHGRGFAVVADEVRKLAEQSGEMAQGIATYIGTIQQDIAAAVQAMEAGTQEVTAGIEVVNGAGASFVDLQDAVDEVTTQIQEVSAAVQQLAASSTRVVEAIGNITEVAEEAASGTQNISASAQEQLASMEEITTSASALSQMAEELEVVIRKFRL